MSRPENAKAPAATGAKELPSERAVQIVVQEVPGVKPRRRHLPEVVAAVALAEDPDPLRAVERVAKYAKAFLVRNGAR